MLINQTAHWKYCSWIPCVSTSRDTTKQKSPSSAPCYTCTWPVFFLNRDNKFLLNSFLYYVTINFTTFPLWHSCAIVKLLVVLIDDDTQSFFALSCFWIVLISLTHFSHFVTSILYWLVAISPFCLCGRLLFYFLLIPSPCRWTRMRFLACYACTLVWLFVYLINSSSEDSTCIQIFLSTFFFFLLVNRIVTFLKLESFLMQSG